MKLRIKGNTLRLRLSRAESEAFAADGRAADAVTFPDGSRLEYVFERWDAAAAVDFDGRRIRVCAPMAEAAEWAAGEAGFAFEAPLPTGQSLNILVEKDFQCLHRRPNEDESDLFPNPAQG